MKNQTKNTLLLALIFSTLFFGALIFNDNINNITSNVIANVFFQKSVDTVELVARFDKNSNPRNTNPKQRITGSQRDIDQKQGKIKIMIVPGHDDQYPGAVFGKITESNLNLQVGEELKSLLEKEDGLEVSIIRDKDGYDPDFQNFIDNNKNEILEFSNLQKEIMRNLIEEGKIESNLNSHGNEALPEVVEILYGINMYVNQNNLDIVIHVHFNDYPGRIGSNGKHNGFVIYVPDKQYSNAEASYDLALKIKNQLEVSFPVSSLPKENAITEDQEYIAIGAYNTSNPISLLIEYGYIYEPQFTDDQFGNIVLEELAKQTYFGILNYLKNTDEFSDNHYESLKNYSWYRNLKNGDEGTDVLALQNYLREVGYYPHNNLNTCPMSGYFGKCTEQALINFQRNNGIQATGFFGDITKSKIVQEF